MTSAANDLRKALYQAENTILRVIEELDLQARQKQADSAECHALSVEASKMVNRWRRTASVAFEGLSAVEREIAEEEKKHAALEAALARKEERLAKMWADSKVVKSAIAVLEESAQRNTHILGAGQAATTHYSGR